MVWLGKRERRGRSLGRLSELLLDEEECCLEWEGRGGSWRVGRKLWLSWCQRLGRVVGDECFMEMEGSKGRRRRSGPGGGPGGRARCGRAPRGLLWTGTRNTGRGPRQLGVADVPGCLSGFQRVQARAGPYLLCTYLGTAVLYVRAQTPGGPQGSLVGQQWAGTVPMVPQLGTRVLQLLELPN